MKFSKKLLIITSILVLLPILVGVFTWNQLPEEIATHWGASGDPDGWSSRGFAVFCLPAILLAIHWVCILATRVDRSNEGQNKKAYNVVLWIIPTVSWFGNGLMYAAVFGIDLNVASLVAGLFAVMFLVIGNYMPKIKPNHTFGIKLPWTFESEGNWNSTHRVAGWVWVIAGFASLACVFVPYKISLFLLPAIFIAAMLIPTVYSYNFHLKEKKEGKPIMKNKKLRKYYIITAIVLGVIFAGLMFVMFSGELEISYTEDGFVIDSMYSQPYEVKYSDIGGTEYSETYIEGQKVMGFNSAKLLMGTFKNDKYGNYQRYTYTGNNGFIIIETMDEKYIIIGAKTLGETRELYNELTERIAG